MAESGTVGTCKWTLDDDGTLTLGPGVFNYAPWLEIATTSPFGTSNAMKVRKVAFNGMELGANIHAMFYGCSSLASLDLSGFDTSNVTGMYAMFDGCSSLTKVTFDGLFAPVAEQTDYGTLYPCFCDRKACTNTTTGLVVTTDADFCALTAAQVAGTWRRGVDFKCVFAVQRTDDGKPDEDGQDVTATCTYATTAPSGTRTLSLYAKRASTSDYPAEPQATASGTADSGTLTATIADLGDDAYDVKCVFSDGESTALSFPSVSSNVRLFELDTSGNAYLAGGASLGGALSAKTASVAGDLTVAGKLSGASASVSGSATVDGDLTVAGVIYGSQPQKVLASPVMYMSSSHSVNLSEPVSEQATGIVLVWCWYNGGVASDANFAFTFVPKQAVALANPCYQVTQICSTQTGGMFAVKSCDVYDDRLVGKSSSGTVTTALGTAKNSNWVLRWVIGV